MKTTKMNKIKQQQNNKNDDNSDKNHNSSSSLQILQFHPYYIRWIGITLYLHFSRKKLQALVFTLTFSIH